MDNSVKGSQPSGAFIFRPNGTDPFKASKSCIRARKIGKTVQNQIKTLFKNRTIDFYHRVISSKKFGKNLRTGSVKQFGSTRENRTLNFSGALGRFHSSIVQVGDRDIQW